MRRVLSFDGQDRRVEAHREPGGDGLRLQIEGAAEEATARPAPGGWTITRGRRSIEAGVTVERSGEIVVQIEGQAFRFQTGRGATASPGRTRDRARGAGGGRSEVCTPMPGKVVRLLREEGDRVAAGDGVLVFEAMKMQNEIRSPESGVIANMRAVAGNSMEGGQLLFAVEPARSP